MSIPREILTMDDLAALMVDVIEAMEVSDMPRAEHLADLELSSELVLDGDARYRFGISGSGAVVAGLATYWLHVPLPEVSETDALDGLGELLNVCAGGLKAMIDGEFTIGIPSLSVGPLDNADAGMWIAVPLFSGTLQVYFGLPVDADVPA